MTNMQRWLRAGSSGAIVFAALAIGAQDAEWLRSWQEAQRHRPRAIASVARIAPPGEAGTPLVIHGRVYKSDGASPAAGVVVFAYQTDAQGLYNARGARGWRLRGWARTDAQGRFEFHTIRPAAYPGTRTPAHVHMTIDGPGLPRRWTPDLNFLDDPFLTTREKQASARAGKFGSVARVTTRGRVQHVDFHLRIANDGRF